MTDQLLQGAQWLDGQRHDYMSRAVVYSRGASAVEVQATIGRTVFEEAQEFGLLRRTESRDFIVRAADLVLDGEQATPAAGDQIRETDVDGSIVHVYEVMSPGTEPFYRLTPYRLTMRIHAKHVATEEAT